MKSEAPRRKTEDRSELENREAAMRRKTEESAISWLTKS